MKRRVLSLLTALALCLSLCPPGALAAEAGPEEIVLTDTARCDKTFTEEECAGGCRGHIVKQSKPEVYPPDLLVKTGTHKITFSGLNLNNGTQIGVEPGAVMDLTLEGENIIIGSYAGIYVPSGAKLVINGPGSLEVTGNSNSAGIGGARRYYNGTTTVDGNLTCGEVVINSGFVKAVGAAKGNLDFHDSAGIGGAYYRISNADIGVGGGGTLTIASTDVLAPDTVLCPYDKMKGTYKIATGDITPDMIEVDGEDALYYTGEPIDLTDRVRVKVSDDGTSSSTITYCGQTFDVIASPEGWEPDPNTLTVTGVGEHTIRYTKGDKTVERTITVKECAHATGTFTHDGGAFHRGTCALCGKELEDAPHAPGEDGTCTGCHAPLARTGEEGNFRYYSSLPGAYDSGDAKLKLLHDFELAEPLTVDRAVELDLGGFTYRCTGTCAVRLAQGGSLTVWDNEKTSTASPVWGKIIAGNGPCFIFEGGSLTLMNGEFTGKGQIFSGKSGTALRDLLGSGSTGRAHRAFFQDVRPVPLDERTELTGTVQVMVCGDNHMTKHIFDEAGHCPACGTDAEAAVTRDGETTFYQLFNDAWAYALSMEGTPVTVTLLRDVTLDSTSQSVGTGCDITLTGEYGINCGKYGGFAVKGGTLTVDLGGTIQTDKIDKSALLVTGGKATVKRGRFVATGSAGGVTAVRDCAIYLENGQTLGDLLPAMEADGTHYCYYAEDGTCVDRAKYKDTKYKDPVSVGPCKGMAFLKPLGGGEHSVYCGECGYQAEAEPCAFVFPEGSGVGTCPCGARAEVTVDAEGLTYDGTAKEPAVTVTVDGAPLEGCTVAYEDNVHAGTASVTVSSGKAWSCALTFEIKKAPLTVTAKNQAIIYGGSIDEGMGQVDAAGLQAGDTLESVTLTASTADVPGGDILVKDAVIKNGTTDVSGDYEIEYVAGVLTIEKSQPTLAFKIVGSLTKEYDGQPFPNPTEEGLEITGAHYKDVQFTWQKCVYVPGDNWTVDLIPLDEAPRNGGDYIVQAYIPETNNTEAAGPQAIDVTIKPKEMTIKGATVAERPYEPGNTAATVIEVIFDGLVEGETWTIGREYGVRAEFDSDSAGVRQVSGELAWMDDVAVRNYLFPFGITFTATGTITKAVLTDRPQFTGGGDGVALKAVEAKFPEGWPEGEFQWKSDPETTKISSGTAYGYTFTPTDTENYEIVEDSAVLWTRPYTPPPSYPVTGVRVEPTERTLEVEESVQLTATVLPSYATQSKAVTWSSSDTEVAEVDGSGNVTAVGAGTAEITVTTRSGGYTAVCVITVKAPPVVDPDPPVDPDDPNPPVVDPDQPKPPADVELKPEVTEGITEVPPALLELEHLNTPEKLEEYMRTAVRELAGTSDGIAVYDVELLVSTDGGVTWTKATPENFPKDGLTLTLPYPAGTDESCKFSVVHMFTVAAFGWKPGETESPEVTNTEQGIRFTVHGLSPVSVSWEEPGKPDVPDVPDIPDVPDEPDVPVRPVWPVWPSYPSWSGGGSSPDVKPEKEPEKEPEKQPEKEPEAIVRPCDGGADCPSRGYIDLGTVGTWYHEAVDYVLRNGAMNGLGAGIFAPDANLSRAQLAQILFNLEGRPAANGLLPFTDVPGSAWYTEAICWAASRGIINGYGSGRFGPDDSITREQLAVMLWRYAGSPAATEKELHFSDAGQAGGWSLEALRWAVENGILSGKGNGMLDPAGLATRAETAEMLKNFSKE